MISTKHPPHSTAQLSNIQHLCYNIENFSNKYVLFNFKSGRGKTFQMPLNGAAHLSCAVSPTMARCQLFFVQQRQQQQQPELHSGDPAGVGSLLQHSIVPLQGSAAWCWISQLCRLETYKQKRSSLLELQTNHWFPQSIFTITEKAGFKTLGYPTRLSLMTFESAS